MEDIASLDEFLMSVVRCISQYSFERAKDICVSFSSYQKIFQVLSVDTFSYALCFMTNHSY